MKFALLSLLVIVFSSTAFAQRRGGVGPRYNPPGSSSHSTGPSRSGTVIRYNDYNHYNDYNDYNTYQDYSYRPGQYGSGPIVVGPRYNPPGSSRYIRTVRRPQVSWSSGFGYSCNMYGDLTLNGRLVHSFRYSSDCSQALSDIRYYGDFCDMEDLYDQTGYLEAQFVYSSECRSALGWYY